MSIDQSLIVGKYLVYRVLDSVHSISPEMRDRIREMAL